MSRYRTGTGSGSRNDYDDSDFYDIGTTYCDSLTEYQGSYGAVVVAFNVIYALALVAIGIFWFLRNRNLSSTDSASKPLKLWNYGLALAFTILGAIVSFGLMASNYRCNNIVFTGDLPWAFVPGTWIYTIGSLLLIYTIALRFTERVRALNGRDFRLLRLVHLGLFAGLCLFALLKLILQSAFARIGTLGLYRGVQAMGFIFTTLELGIAISVITFCSMALLGIRKKSALPTSFSILLAAFLVCYFARSFIPWVVWIEYRLQDYISIVGLVDRVNCVVAFQIIFDIATFALLALLGTSDAVLGVGGTTVEMGSATISDAEPKVMNGV